ncbi:acyl-CoA dehydrogenase family protein [Actinopolymorpha singaporensis]|uniref:Acyl-[acyl-carrier-protein] dehydrogenase MbtN n=1 Tax=Actinopolymorpha singaporensis TaxID=117157 RepID=A0A1H1NKC0_9ACTN|nr:acyl-CoA dehydrogenase family protein [Actinopolymorpha singaporensis]SDR99491.1 Acyl-CoA dehydrogenase [Actinopolymorpha singaporensis]
MRAHGYFDADHDAFRESFRTFCAREVVPRQPGWDKAGLVDRDVWLAAGRQGFLVPAADEAYGGLGITDLRYEQVMIEELAAVHESGFGLGLHNGVVAPYLLHAATRSQKRRFLTRAVTGEAVLAIAITEPEAGSDAAALRTRAVEDGDHWVLDGAKTFISNGITADLVLVAARTEPDRRHGIGLFVVESGTPGFTRGRKLDKLGLRTQDTAELFFGGCRVPKQNVLGHPGEGFVQLTRQFAQERLVVAMSAVASAEVALQDTIAYVRERQAFGRPLSAFQDTRFRVASLRTEVDVAQAYVDQCVLAANAGALDAPSAAQAKLFATEMLGRVVDDCVQMHGGYGYMWEYPICRAYADARVQRIYAGTSEIMKDIISRAMLGPVSKGDA